MKHGTKELIFTWAMIDPLAARDALQVIPAEMVREAAVSSLVGGWAKGGKPGVDEYVIALDSEPLRRKLTAVVVTWMLRREGPEAVLAWAESQPGDERDGFRAVAMERTVNQVAVVDPERTLRWVEKHSGKTYARTLPRELAKRWVPTDPESAFAWITTLEDPEQQSELSKVGFTRWWKLDNRSARRWITTAELAPVHDPAVAVFASNLARQEPESSLIWAGRIRDEALRGQTQAELLRFWINRSPGPAAAWIEGSNLPQSVIEAARTAPAKRGRRGPGGG
jgi:hypothetical protein